ncbi:MAG: TIGR00366 family protein, partial [Flavobacteriales bacterium]
LPESIGLLETIFSGWSIGITGGVIVAITLMFAWLGKVVQGNENIDVPAPREQSIAPKSSNPSPEGFAERLDAGRWLSFLLGFVCVAGTIWWMFKSENWLELKFITPDWINMVLLGAAFLAHNSIRGFLQALDQAIQGGSGILVQFPLYFGIMGVVTGTGLGSWIAESLVQSTSLHSLSLALFTSSGLLNIFVPSGGGQWAVQGPLVLESCQALGLDYSKGIMAMAYGDQLTNMLQPFWALPLLGITGLKARDILPFTLMMMMVAGIIMAAGMLFWV